MAEAAVLYLIRKITDATVNGALKKADFLVSHLTKVQAGVREVKRELEFLSAFLRYADTYKESNQLVDTWVKQVREVTFDIEDIIDDYTYLLEERHSNSGLKVHLHNAIYCFKHIKSLYKIADRLEQTRTVLRDIVEKKAQFGIKTPEGSTRSEDEHELSRRLAESAHFIEEDEIVGFKHHADVLVNWLMDEEPRRTTITVWGMGGVGKTTLVTSVYNTPTVRSRFDCNAWVSVSQNYDTVDLLRRIIKELYQEKMEVTPGDINLMDYRRLVETLRTHLQQKKYLIILDDVWRTDVWNYVSAALFDNNSGGRVVVTTRNQDVASIAAASRSMKLKPLEEIEAWTLFCRNAFRREKEKQCPPELECWARKIASKCQGLPLATVSIGNLLSVKERTESAWRYVHDALVWEQSDIPELQKVSTILNFSINDLPYYLRNCLLYCSLYPDDYEMEKKTLIRLWVAEGFVEERGESTMEEVAQDYLNQLVGRCMLQVKPNYDNIRRTNCFKVHHLVRDMIVAKSRNESFCEVYDTEVKGRSGERVRRLSIANMKDYGFSMVKPQLRSLHAFSSVLSHSSFASSRLLRVLNLDHTFIDTLPDAVFCLFNLRFLSLRYTMVRELPVALGRLRKLETLDTRCTRVEKLPSGITKLENLRHLMVNNTSESNSRCYADVLGLQVPKGIWKLKRLQTLKTVAAHEGMVQLLENLDQLRVLEVSDVTSNQCMGLSASISKMKLLHNLAVSIKHRTVMLRLEELSPPPLLRTLYLDGKLEKGMLPCWFGSVTNLSKLRLRLSGLKDDSLFSLSILPNLEYLSLEEAYEGQKLHFHGRWSPKLKILWLCDMARLSCIEIAKEALTNLQSLILVRCRELKMLPLGIENLTNLQKLTFDSMPNELVEKLRRGGEDRRKVSRIPIVRSWVMRKDKWIEESLC